MKEEEKDIIEWTCPECETEGMYSELNRQIQLGVDLCPTCRSEVESVE